MFTGDESGRWLYRALFRAGFASKEVSESRDDGMVLKDCYITAACRCAPPANKPLPEELTRCRPFLLEEIRLLRDLRIIVGLGRIGFDMAFNTVRSMDLTSLTKRPAFAHGAVVPLSDRLILIGSYHPSQQNTFTGVLTEPMFDAIFSSVRRHL